jgi:hypothetical protein
MRSRPNEDGKINDSRVTARLDFTILIDANIILFCWQILPHAICLLELVPGPVGGDPEETWGRFHFDDRYCLRLLRCIQYEIHVM